MACFGIRFHRGSGTCLVAVLTLILANLITSCRKSELQPTTTELPPGVILQDRTFYSEAIRAQSTYRIIEPVAFRPGQPVHVVYLLHGNGEDYRTWSRCAPMVQLAAKGYVLVMPDGHSSYFMNSSAHPDQKFEDFVTRDLVSEVESRLPRVQSRAIVGNSMGGFAAIVLAFKHPGMYRFVGALSPPLDVTRRPFTLRRLSQSLGLRSIFGPAGSSARRENDPFLLERKADAETAPIIFLTAGDQESLLPIVWRFKSGLRTRQWAFQRGNGGHNWQNWDEQIPLMLQMLQSAM